MKYLTLFLMICLLTTGCVLRGREEELEKRTAELNQREQELLLRERSLQLREEELVKKERLLDSTSGKNVADTLSALHPELLGIWTTRMNCVETSCPGSAVGDTKTEQWEFSFQDNTVIIKAMSGNELARIYSGVYSGNTIELAAQQDVAGTQPNLKMTVRLQPGKNNEMTGRREIVRGEECRIVYALELKKH